MGTSYNFASNQGFSPIFSLTANFRLSETESPIFELKKTTGIFLENEKEIVASGIVSMMAFQWFQLKFGQLLILPSK